MDYNAGQVANEVRRGRYAMRPLESYRLFDPDANKVPQQTLTEATGNLEAAKKWPGATVTEVKRG